MEQKKVLVVVLSTFGTLALVFILGALFLYPLPFSGQMELGSPQSRLLGTNDPLDPPEEDPNAEGTNENSLLEELESNELSADEVMSNLQDGSDTEYSMENPGESDIALPVEDSGYSAPAPQNNSRSTSSGNSTSTTVQRQDAPATRTVHVREFWIQVGAYSDRYQAQFISEKLQDQGLGGHLFTTQSGGQTLFRVRIGPYETRSEAEKFLSWITPLEGFENAYVSQVTATREQ